MIFVDSNVPMYLVGADHPNKRLARLALETAAESGLQLVTDAEVLQEILHRYNAINRLNLVDEAIGAIRGVVDVVHPIEEVDVLAGRRLLVNGLLSARDAIHVAIMQRYEIHRIMSFDRAFDAVPGLERLAG